MADNTIFEIPIETNLDLSGKSIMIHDLTQPEATSTKLINFEETTHTEVTYAELTNLINTSQLIKGQFYVLIDFETIYDQMDFDNSGNLKSSLVTKTGTIERIWLLALNENTIADKAYSETFPNDEIKYDVTYSSTFVNGSPAKGRISERIDEWNNRTDYDHREIKFIRYDDGTGNFTIVNDNGNALQEYLTFGNNYATNTGEVIVNNYLGDFYSRGIVYYGQEYSNNVFTANTIFDNISNSLFHNNTFIESVISNIFRGSVIGNIFNKSFNYNLINGSVNINMFNGNVNNNIFNGSLTNNTFNTGAISYNVFNGVLNSNTFIYTNELRFVTLTGNIAGKTINETIYPLLFGGLYEKMIFRASDGKVYFRYFNGTNEVYTLIP